MAGVSKGKKTTINDTAEQDATQFLKSKYIIFDAIKYSEHQVYKTIMVLVN